MAEREEQIQEKSGGGSPIPPLTRRQEILRRTLHVIVYLFSLGLIVVPLAREQANRKANAWRILSSPYPPPPWTTMVQARAQLHTHTTQSEGVLPPHEVIDRYAAIGTAVLALTDHNEVTWPWTQLSALPLKGRSRRNTSVSLDNRDPKALGMIAIGGCEWSDHHHMSAWFTEHSGRSNEIESLRESLASYPETLAIFNHPGRYTKPAEWYTAHFRAFPSLIGMEVYNQGDRYPGDRVLWDTVLSALMPERPVWGFSNDDMHEISDIGRNWNVLLLTNRSDSAVREALVNGHFWFVYSPLGPTGPPPPIIHAIETHERKGTITIATSGATQTLWISEGRVVATGTTFQAVNHPDARRYVRALVQGTGGVVGTQPFPLYRPLELDLEVRFDGGRNMVINDDRFRVKARLTAVNKSSRLVKPFVEARFRDRRLFIKGAPYLQPEEHHCFDFTIPGTAFYADTPITIHAMVDDTFEPYHEVVLYPSLPKAIPPEKYRSQQ